MTTTISKSIGEGFAHNPIYAALAYDTGDFWGGYQIKDVMFNTTYKAYFYDAGAYIHSSTSTQLDLVATEIVITGNLTVSGSLDYGSQTVSLSQSLAGTLTVGVANAGYDVLFYGKAGSGQWLWNADQDTNGGVTMTGTFDITGNMELKSTSTLTVGGTTTLTGAVTTVSTFTSGTTDSGKDVLFHGDGDTCQWLWDADANTNKGGVVMRGTYQITGASTLIGALTVGTLNSGHDVTFYGDISSKCWKWIEETNTMDVLGDVAIEGSTTIIGTIGITGDITMATQSQINFEDTATYIHASGTNVLALVGPTIDLEGDTAITLDGDTSVVAAHTFTTGSGNVTLAGNVTVSGSKTFTSGTGAISLTGAITITNTLTVGASGTSFDVKFWSATAAKYFLWDESKNELSIVHSLVAADPGAYDAGFKTTWVNEQALTEGRLCAMSINCEPLAATDAFAITGAEICTYIAADATVSGGPVRGLFVETQGGTSIASDWYSLYVYSAPGQAPSGTSAVMRLDHNSAVATTAFLIFNNGSTCPSYLFNVGSNQTDTAWAYTGSLTEGAGGWLKILVGSAARYIQLYDTKD